MGSIESASSFDTTVTLLRDARRSCTLLPGSPEYEEARKGFWAQDQANTTPYCIFQPNSAQDVSDAVQILRRTGCPFAIKSGGHGRLAGESSITAGVLIDLKRLNQITLSNDQTSCRVGPGNSWKDVYKVLNSRSLTVVGGRASTVGVGGFCVSGNHHGDYAEEFLSIPTDMAGPWIMCCLLRSSSQMEPSFRPISPHPDLYRALRGGGANFGIVTDLNLKVYPYEGMWGGGRNWSLDHTDAVIDAFLNYGHDSNNNADVSVILGVINHQGTWIIHADLGYLYPSVPVNQPVLQKFLDIPSVHDNTRVASQIERVQGIADHYPQGSYNGFWTFCTQSDKRIIRFFLDTWMEETTPILDIKGFDRSALADCQFVTKSIIDAMSRDGGNVLGLTGDGPFLLMLMEPYWVEASQSHRVWSALRTTATKVQDEARRLGLEHRYIYLNYANPFQDVYAGYGPDSAKFMRSVSTKYDPDGVFQSLRQAGWHLNGPIVEAEKNGAGAAQ